ncbi:unnamed protein product [Rotaria sp. Silwood2]|nr:unnamed protein product [Rotaria sp. Silwood2]
MGDKPRLSVASSTGLKGAAAATQFKRLFNQPSISSLSNHEDSREERIELENLLGTEDLEKLRSQGFVCRIYIKKSTKVLSFIYLVGR